MPDTRVIHEVEFHVVEGTKSRCMLWVSVWLLVSSLCCFNLWESRRDRRDMHKGKGTGHKGSGWLFPRGTHISIIKPLSPWTKCLPLGLGSHHGPGEGAYSNCSLSPLPPIHILLVMKDIIIYPNNLQVSASSRVISRVPCVVWGSGKLLSSVRLRNQDKPSPVRCKVEQA